LRVIGACAVVLTRTVRVTCPADRCRARGTLRTKEICPRRLQLLLLLLLQVARALVLVLLLMMMVLTGSWSVTPPPAPFALTPLAGWVLLWLKFTAPLPLTCAALLFGAICCLRLCR